MRLMLVKPLVLTVALLSLSEAVNAADASGVWRGVIGLPDETGKVEAILAQNGSSLTGSVTLRAAGGAVTPLAIVGGVVTGGTISFRASKDSDIGGASLTCDGHIGKETLAGSCTLAVHGGFGGGGQGEVTAELGLNRADPPNPQCGPAAWSKKEQTAYAYTMADMRSFAVAMAIYKVDEGRYPVGRTFEEVCDILDPDYIVKMPRLDQWGKAFSYAGSPTGSSYSLASAGSDGLSQGVIERLWCKPGADLVMRDGIFQQACRPDSVWREQDPNGQYVKMVLDAKRSSSPPQW